jgi:hypothetical protein
MPTFIRYECGNELEPTTAPLGICAPVLHLCRCHQGLQELLPTVLYNDHLQDPNWTETQYAGVSA